MTLNKYNLYFIQRKPSGKENQWVDEVIPHTFAEDKSFVAVTLDDYMHLRGYSFMDGGYERTDLDGTFTRAIDTAGYPEAVEVE